ncbi:ABC transporter permease [Anaerolineales bacterium HSG24]|nr:ABC transporter permease [Anaerolineales bacterium HSG24]
MISAQTRQQSISKITVKPFINNWHRYLDMLLLPIVLTLFIALWQLVVWMNDYPAFILPTPIDVIYTLNKVLVDGTLWHHTQVTLFEIFAGLTLGITTATVFGYGLAKSQLLEKILAPYLVAMQSVPVIAVAPLIIIWVGSGYLSKVLICALMVFFPVLINTIVGIRSVEPNLHDLMHSLQASRWQTFTMLELPAALPILLGGLKVGVTLSVIGAVVGEFMGANEGLGFLINQARGLFNTPLVFVAILTLVIITLFLYGMVTLIEARLLRWRG